VKVSERLKLVHAAALHRWRWRRTPVRRIGRSYARRHGLVVRSGPFSGLRFPRLTVGRSEMLVAQLIGCYELELHPVFTRLIETGADTVVDLGASDGYYAVGLARACPDSSVLAYEMNPLAADVCRRVAEENGVGDRVEVRGEATVDELAGLNPPGAAFVLCDCEGAEAQLMDPVAVPWLATATLVVELHEFASPGVEKLIAERFARSHDIEVVPSRRRFVGEHPEIAEVPGLSYIDQEIAVSEFRHTPISWAVMHPSSGSAQ
jgi:predicted O-methyltransferase YrrM